MCAIGYARMGMHEASRRQPMGPKNGGVREGRRFDCRRRRLGLGAQEALPSVPPNGNNVPPSGKDVSTRATVAPRRVVWWVTRAA